MLEHIGYCPNVDFYLKFMRNNILHSNLNFYKFILNLLQLCFFKYNNYQ